MHLPGVLRAFQRFRFLILERTVVSMYSSNALNGLIIDLGYHWTDVSAVCDGFLLMRARVLRPHTEAYVRKECITLEKDFEISLP